MLQGILTMGTNSASRAGIAELTSAGVATSWDPSAGESSVKDMAIATSTMYLAGSFNMIGGQARSGVVEINLSDGSPTAWIPPIIDTGAGNAILLSTSSVYVLGTMTSV